MTKTEFLKIKGRIYLLFDFYGKPCSDDLLDIYMYALSDYDYDLLETSIKETVKTYKFLPKPSEIIDVIKKLTKQTEQDEERQKSILEFKASNAFRKLMRNLDVGEDIVCTDWRIVWAVRLAFGSVMELAKSKEGNPWLEKKFIKAYLLAESPTKCGYILGGIYHKTKDPRVRFLGEYEACSKIANDFYNASGQTPRLPLQKEKKLLANPRTLHINYKNQNQLSIEKNKDNDLVSRDEVLKGIEKIKEIFVWRDSTVLDKDKQ